MTTRIEAQAQSMCVAWLQERCTVRANDYSTALELWQDFEKWFGARFSGVSANERAAALPRRIAFGRALRHLARPHGVQPDKIHNQRVWVGLALKGSEPKASAAPVEQWNPRETEAI